LGKNITKVNAAPFVRSALKEYGTNVIQGRSIADIRDGLKPVQRRILYSMYEEGMRKNKAHRKSNKVVGDTMGNYHPHGDTSIYETLVNMVHHRYPLIEGQGNFGGVVDPPAASRYTECRPTNMGDGIFECINAATMVDNYSASRREPTAIPARAPMLLLNGSEGIAYGIEPPFLPPHNLKEIGKLVLQTLKLKHTPLNMKQLLRICPGPDFSRGILTSTEAEVEELYATGRGILRFRCRYEILHAKDHWILQVTSLAPRFNLNSFFKKCGELCDEGQLEYVTDASDDQTRILVGFINPRIIEQRVLKLLHTSVKFAFYFLAPDSEGQTRPTITGLREIIDRWLSYREQIEKEILRQQIAHLQEQHLREDAKLAAMRNLDAVFKVLQNQTLTREEKIKLLERELLISAEQTRYVYTLSLSQLDALNEQDVLQRLTILEDGIIDRRYEMDNIEEVIRRELKKIIKSHGDKRRMPLREDEPALPKASKEDVTLDILVGKDGQVERKSPSTRGKGTPWWSFVLHVHESLTLVERQGSALVVDAAFLKKGKIKTSSSIIGAIDDSAECIIAKDSEGYVGVTLYKQSSKNFVVLKSEEAIVQAFGLSSGDHVIAVDQGKTKILSFEDFNPKRQNSKGQRLIPRRANYRIIHVPAGSFLANAKGRMKKAEWKTLHKKDGLIYVVHEKNYVIYEDGSKQILSAKDLVSVLAEKRPDQIFQLK